MEPALAKLFVMIREGVSAALLKFHRHARHIGLENPRAFLSSAALSGVTSYMARSNYTAEEIAKLLEESARQVRSGESQFQNQTIEQQATGAKPD